MKESNHRKLARRKNRIAARLAPRNWQEQSRPMMKGGRPNAEVSDRLRIGNCSSETRLPLR